MPEGVRDLHDAPYTVVAAIRRAMLYLSFDEMLPDERPPRRMWDNDDELSEWFEAVERNRKRDMSSSPIEDPVQNELTAGFRG